jgi:hypothetical protein
MIKTLHRRTASLHNRPMVNQHNRRTVNQHNHPTVNQHNRRTVNPGSRMVNRDMGNLVSLTPLRSKLYVYNKLDRTQGVTKISEGVCWGNGTLFDFPLYPMRNSSFIFIFNWKFG